MNDPTSEPTAIERRALARIQEDLTHKRYKAVALAKRSGRLPSTISAIVNGKRSLSFEVVEAAAHLKGVDPGEFLADPKSEVRVLDPIEAEVLRYLRSWPKHIQKTLADFLRYFDEVQAVEKQVRDLVAYFRTLGHTDKLETIANIKLRNEGRLPRDVPSPPKASTPRARVVDVSGLSTADEKLAQEFVRNLRSAHTRRTASRS